MKCPKCGENCCKYLQRRNAFQKTRKKKFVRTDFTAECKRCGWKGEI